MNRFLTRQERQFTLGYLQEQYEGMRQGKVPEGPAFKWMAENGLAHREFQPFTLALTEELGRGSPVPPPEEEYSAPWASIEEFRRRAAELDQAVHGVQRQARVEDNVHRRSPLAHLNGQELAFLWGYALERGNLKLGAYHEMADAHGVGREETMRLAVLAMKEMTGEMPGRLEDLPPPPPWPFEKDPAEILTEIRNAKAEENASQADR
jgi:hypothetical protein